MISRYEMFDALYTFIEKRICVVLRELGIAYRYDPKEDEDRGYSRPMLFSMMFDGLTSHTDV